jgi:hypothetical protein
VVVVVDGCHHRDRDRDLDSLGLVMGRIALKMCVVEASVCRQRDGLYSMGITKTTVIVTMTFIQ